MIGAHRDHYGAVSGKGQRRDEYVERMHMRRKFGLVPRDQSFFELFEQQAEVLRECLPIMAAMCEAVSGESQGTACAYDQATSSRPRCFTTGQKANVVCRLPCTTELVKRSRTKACCTSL